MGTLCLSGLPFSVLPEGVAPRRLQPCVEGQPPAASCLAGGEAPARRALQVFTGRIQPQLSASCSGFNQLDLGP